MDNPCVAQKVTASVVDNGQSAPYYFDETYAWSNVDKTLNENTEPTPNSGWQTYIASQGSWSYLWKRIIKYTWNENTWSYTAGSAQYIRVTGAGVKITPKGTLLKAYEEDTDMETGQFHIGNVEGTWAVRQADNQIYVAVGVYDQYVRYEKLRDYGGSLVKASDGDAYTVTSECYVDLGDGQGSVNVEGCLLMWSTEASKWVNLGRFKGDPGTTYYTHIAWCNKLGTGTNWTGQGTDFTTSKNDSDRYMYQGVLINTDGGADPDITHAGDYTWNQCCGNDACAPFIDKTAFFVANNLEGYVANGLSIGTFNLSYMVGNQKYFPWLYMPNGTTRINSAVLLERNLDIEATNNFASNQAEFRLFTASSYSGEKLQLSGQQKSYTFILRGALSSSATDYNHGWPDLKITITLQGNDPELKNVQTQYLALSCATESDTDTRFGATPPNISRIYWENSIPTNLNNSYPYIWRRTTRFYNNLEESVTVELIDTYAGDSLSVAKTGFSLPTDPKFLLLGNAERQITAVQFLTGGVPQQIHDIVLNVKPSGTTPSGTTFYFGFDIYLIGGTKTNGTIVSSLYGTYTAQKFDFNAYPYASVTPTQAFKSISLMIVPKPNNRLFWMVKSGTTNNYENVDFQLVVSKDNSGSAGNTVEGAIHLGTTQTNEYNPLDVSALFNVNPSGSTQISIGKNQGLWFNSDGGVYAQRTSLYVDHGSTGKQSANIKFIPATQQGDIAVLWYDSNSVGSDIVTRVVSEIKIYDDYSIQTGYRSIRLT